MKRRINTECTPVSLTGVLYHRDGTVTYWSVYRQSWIMRTATVPDAELAAMGRAEREQVTRHIRETP